LLTDRLRVLGPDHPDTVFTRHNLDRWKNATAKSSCFSSRDQPRKETLEASGLWGS
jgi:hypothetical protein